MDKTSSSYKSMWNFDESGKIIGMNLDNIPKETYICHRCGNNKIALGHKSLCSPCLTNKESRDES